MKVHLLVTAVLGIPISVNADEFHKFIRVDCNKTESFLAIHYEGGYNEEGENLMKAAGESAINPRDLIEYEGDRVSAQHSVKSECILNGRPYLIEIEPIPGAGNVQAQCGVHVTAKFTLFENEQVLALDDFGDECPTDATTKIRIRFLWRAGEKSPEVTEVEHAEFYR